MHNNQKMGQNYQCRLRHFAELRQSRCFLRRGLLASANEGLPVQSSAGCWDAGWVGDVSFFGDRSELRRRDD